MDEVSWLGRRFGPGRTFLRFSASEPQVRRAAATVGTGQGDGAGGGRVSSDAPTPRKSRTERGAVAKKQSPLRRRQTVSLPPPTHTIADSAEERRPSCASRVVVLVACNVKMTLNGRALRCGRPSSSSSLDVLSITSLIIHGGCNWGFRVIRYSDKYPVGGEVRGPGGGGAEGEGGEGGRRDGEERKRRWEEKRWGWKEREWGRIER